MMTKRKLREELARAKADREFYFFMLCKTTAEQMGRYDEAERLYQMWVAEKRVDGLRVDVPA